MKTATIPPAAPLLAALAGLTKNTNQAKGLIKLLADRVTAPLYASDEPHAADQANGIELLVDSLLAEMDASLLAIMKATEQGPHLRAVS